jgi:hypothetical protein
MAEGGNLIMGENLKVELFVQLCVNGRPLWNMSKSTKSESTLRMTEKEYGRIVDAAIKELSIQTRMHRDREAVEASQPK